MRTLKYGTTATAAIMVAIGIILSVAGGCGKKPPSEAVQKPIGSVEEALHLLDSGEDAAAEALLRSIVTDDPTGRTGDHAALVLGSLLTRQSKHADAVAFLLRAESGTVAPSYAKLMLARAIVEGGIQDQMAPAAARAAALSQSKDTVTVTPFVREEAHLLLLRANSLLQNWSAVSSDAVEFLQRWPESRALDEATWLAAEARRATGDRQEAQRLYCSIWYERPASRWAKDAHLMIQKLESEGFPGRSLSPAERLKFARSLQAVGLHQEALSEIENYLSRGGSETAEALAMKTGSLLDTRKNTECVQVAEQMKTRYPGSKWAASAGINAIKALRRGNNTNAIRAWSNWIHDQYPGKSYAFDALYNLGTYLQNTVSHEQGIAVLEQMLREGPQSESAPDALWKLAWANRNSGNTDVAIGSLDRILTGFPKSGFRKAALYWTARLSEDRDVARSEDLYQTLLRQYPHDYYGHQARTNLAAMGRAPLSIGNAVPLPPIDTLDPRRIRRQETAYTQAVNLKSIGLYDYAAGELTRVPGVGNDAALQFALADLLSRSGDAMRAQQIVRKQFGEFVVAGSRDTSLVPMAFWRVCYPYNYRAHIKKAIGESGLSQYGIDPYLVAALIRMESLFQPTALSPVGAVGLMQLMPETAEKIAKEQGLPTPTRSDLFRPDVNIRYGTKYLADRVREFGGNWFPAICSYNAGPDPVREWWAKRSPEMQDDEFIENIPYVATRIYIKQILGDYRNYEWIYPEG